MAAPMKTTIKNVSINLFYKKGYFATSISDIARASGIQKSSIYYHYANKEDLLFDILETTMMDLDAQLEAHLAEVNGPIERMRAAVLGHVLFHVDRQKEAIISDSELRGLTVKNYKTIIRMRDAYEHKLQGLIREGIERGVFREVDAKIVSYGILTMCTAVATWFAPSGRLNKEEAARVYTDFILHGLIRDEARTG